TSSPTSEHLLPHIFPTFGVTKTTQAWIYGSLSLILIFLVAFGAWWYRQRRKRHWMARDDYSFEMVGHDEDDSRGDGTRAAGGAAGGAGTGGRPKAKQLYDAFAPDSSEDEFGDEEPFHVGSDDDEEDDERRRSGQRLSGARYRDDEPSRS
ncbi:hypothetical protein KC340_g16016, partial [Hortaea werneckii]